MKHSAASGRGRLVELLFLLLLSHAPRLEAEAGHSWTHSFNPVAWAREARANSRNGVYFAPDKSTHPSRGAAWKAAWFPSSVSRNVMGGLALKRNPLTMAEALFMPLGIELQRQVASGSVDLRRLGSSMLSLEPLAAFTGWIAGDALGAALQPILARMGVGGAVAGFALRTILGFSGFVFGMNFGENFSLLDLSSEKAGWNRPLSHSVADSIRSIHPVRDFTHGLLYGFGALAGQVLFPVYPIGGVLGGMLVGGFGAWLGRKIADWPIVREVDRALQRCLTQLAQVIDGRVGRKVEDKDHILTPVAAEIVKVPADLAEKAAKIPLDLMEDLIHADR